MTWAGKGGRGQILQLLEVTDGSGGCKHKGDSSREREPVRWVQYISSHLKYTALKGVDASLCHQVKTGHKQTEGPRSCVLYTLGNIFTLVDPVKYKAVAKQHPVPMRDQKHFLL